MAERLCPRCLKPIPEGDLAAFCPFCGEKLHAGLDLSAVLAETNPVKKHDRLLALHKEHPESLEIAEELLHLGRLYERGKKGVDFSIIKCYLLMIYLEPDTLRKEQIEAFRTELFHHPDLDRCLELAPDRGQFLRRYLGRLSEDFIRLFLKGSSRYMHVILGFSSEGKAPKYLAQPAARMLLAIREDGNLAPAERDMLSRAFYASFARMMDGETRYLDETLGKYGIKPDAE